MSQDVFKAPKSRRRQNSRSKSESETTWSPIKRTRRSKEDFFNFCNIVLEYAQYESMKQEDLRASNNTSPLDSLGSTAESFTSDSTTSSTFSETEQEERTPESVIPRTEGYMFPKHFSPKHNGYSSPPHDAAFQGCTSPKHPGHLSPRYQGYTSPKHNGQVSPKHYSHASPKHNGHVSPKHDSQMSVTPAKQNGHMSPKHNGYMSPKHVLSASKHSDYSSPPSQGYTSPKYPSLQSPNSSYSGEHDESEDENELITCFCMKPFAGRPMIECSSCLTWIHLSCAKIRKSNIPEEFECANCKESKFTTRKSSRQRRESKMISA